MAAGLGKGLGAGVPMAAAAGGDSVWVVFMVPRVRDGVRGSRGILDVRDFAHRCGHSRSRRFAGAGKHLRVNAPKEVNQLYGNFGNSHT